MACQQSSIFVPSALDVSLNCMTLKQNSIIITTTGTASYTHAHPLNGPLSGTTQASWYQKGKTNLDFTEARDSEWQWHQLGHMQVCTLLQTDNHANTSPFSFFYRPDALPAAQPTASKHWHCINKHQIILIIPVAVWHTLKVSVFSPVWP